MRVGGTRWGERQACWNGDNGLSAGKLCLFERTWLRFECMLLRFERFLLGFEHTWESFWRRWMRVWRTWFCLLGFASKFLVLRIVLDLRKLLKIQCLYVNTYVRHHSKLRILSTNVSNVRFIWLQRPFHFQLVTINPNKPSFPSQCPSVTMSPFPNSLQSISTYFCPKPSHPCANKPALKHYIGFKANYINSVNCITVLKESSGSLKLIFLFSLPRL
jgi:hypothetical protein